MSKQTTRWLGVSLVAWSSLIGTAVLYGADPAPMPLSLVTVGERPLATLSGPSSGMFVVTRLGGATQPLTIHYALGGTASNGVDYVRLPGTVTLPAGQLRAGLVVEPIVHNAITTNRTVDFTFQSGTNYVFRLTEAATVTLRYHDPLTNRPPVIQFNASTSSPSTITLSASASDADGWIKTVQFLRGTQSVAVLSNAVAPLEALEPFRYVLTNQAAGSYTFTAKATDNLGATILSQAITITVPATTNYPPTVAITSPTNNTSFLRAPTNILITVDATDRDGTVKTVEVYQGTTRLGVATNNPMSASPMNLYRFNWTNVPAGSYALTAKAADNAGLSTTSAPVHITVSSGESRLTWISSPTNNALFVTPTNIAITAMAVDRLGLVKTVEIIQDGVRVAILTTNQPSVELGRTNTFHFTWTNTPTGSHHLTSKVTDSLGVSFTSAPVHITVEAKVTNHPPVVSIRTPTNNATFTPPAIIPLLVEAYDPDTGGSIKSVEIYQGATKIGTAMYNPALSSTQHGYTFTWSNVLAGSYSLTARATDNLNLSATSAPVRITVAAVTNHSQLVITSPTNGALFTAPTNIAIRATAMDPKGYINIVDFYEGTHPIGQSILLFGRFPDPGTVLTHSFIWTNVSAGSYTLTARGRDSSSTTITSAPVQITVRSPAPASFVERQLPPSYQAGTKLTVKLVAKPAQGTSTYAVEDLPPAGWRVSNITHEGALDTLTQKVKFGPYFDHANRTLTYNVTPPATATGTKTFVGEASQDGVRSAISGQSTIALLRPIAHPADNNPTNFIMTLSEVTAYGHAWKNGLTWPIAPNPIPASYVTRAGALWKAGEAYKYDPSAGQPPLCWVSETTSVVRPLAAARATMGPVSSAVSSDLPATVARGGAFTVKLLVSPGAGIAVYAVEDQVPAGWTVSAVSNDGLLDPMSARLKWGPFFDATPRTLTYQVTPKSGASGWTQFRGVASFDGSDVAIAGQRQTQVLAGAALSSVKRSANGAVELTFSGETGRTYAIEVSSDLIHWLRLGQQQNTEGTWQFTDTGAAEDGMRFYRAVSLP